MASLSLLPWCPPHVPGEVLYSYAARLSKLNSLGDSRTALFALFGARQMIPSADLPGHLDDAQERIGAAAGFDSVLSLVDRSTLFPFYRFFMSPERWERILPMARGGNGGGLKTAMGIVANGFGASTVFRSCVMCNRDIWARYGTVVWHSMHQLPGVVVCPIHGCTLIAHFQQSRLSHRHELHSCPAGGNPPNITKLWSPMLGRYAQLAHAVLNHVGKSPSLAARQVAYHNALADRGWIRGEQQVSWKPLGLALQKRFHRFAPFEFQQRLRAGSGDCPSWVRSALSSRDRFVHPVCHLLLIDLLFESLDSFLDACNAKPACIGLPDSQNSEPDAGGLSHLMDGTISCRVAATRLGLSVTTVVKRRRALGLGISERRKTLHPKLIAELKTALMLGHRIADIASRFAISSVSVSRVLAESAEIVAHRDHNRETVARTEHRRRWFDVMKSHPGVGVRELRKVAGASYAWLYRNDRMWLRQNVPETSDRHISSDRIDWASRDAVLTSKVAGAVRRLAETAVVPKRISSARIISEIYSESSARAHASQLPAFWAAVRTGSETHEQFKSRVGSAAVRENE
jgi:hypothetical protein